MQRDCLKDKLKKIYCIVSDDTARLSGNQRGATGCSHGLIEPVNNLIAGSCGERQPVHEKPAGIFYGSRSMGSSTANLPALHAGIYEHSRV